MICSRRLFAHLVLSCAAAAALAACSSGDAGSSPAPTPPSVAPQAPQAYETHVDTSVLKADVDILALATGLPSVGDRLVATADDLVSDFARRAGASQRENPGYFQRWTLDVHWAPSLGSAEVLSLMGLTQSYEGGAHGTRDYASVLWDKSAGREVSFADMFADPRRNRAAMTAVSDAAFAAWAEASPAVDADLSLIDERTLQDAREVLAPDARSFDTFVLIPNTVGDGRAAGVMLLYGPDVLGPFGDGDYRLFIPAEVLIPHLKPEWARRFGGGVAASAGG